MGLFSLTKDAATYEEFIELLTSAANEKQKVLDLALEIGINKISDVISKCKFEYHTKNGITNEAEYLLNVKPNPNQCSVDFWKQVIAKMIKEDEGCLVVNLKSGLYIVDSFTTDTAVQKEKTYSNITIVVDDNTMTLRNKYKSSEVLHFKYSNPLLINFLRSVNSEIEELYKVACMIYKQKQAKVLIQMPSTNVSLKDAKGNPLTTNEYAKSIAEKLSSSEIQGIITSAGINVSYIEGKTALSVSEIKELKENIYENTAMALGIPTSVFYGTVSEKSDANNEFITYACEPIIKNMNSVLNGSLLEKEEYEKGDRFFIDTGCVKHIDVIEQANNLDKLYSNGWSHNDILKLIGRPPIEEKWAEERRFTKNYSTSLEGGE